MTTQYSGKKIIVSLDGPYSIEGDILLVRKSQVVTENGEPISWKDEGEISVGSDPALCRCGHSHEKPCCDGTHCDIGFDGTETALTGSTVDHRQTLPASTGLVIRRDFTLCMDSGFCANLSTSVDEMADKTSDPTIRAQVIDMIERCPSGSYTYAPSEDAMDSEPELPQQISVTTEMTSEGPVMGSLWVTGGIPIERADGQPFETRNRVTLCRCGLSEIKPLCDGAHRTNHVKEDE